MYRHRQSVDARSQLVDWWVLAGILGAVGFLLAVSSFAR